MKISENLLAEISNNDFTDAQLVLDGPGIHAEDMFKLVSAVKLNKYIKKIFLGGVESIDEESLKLLTSLNDLEEITIIDCGVTDLGVRELLKSKVKALYLSSNYLSDVCLEGIENNKTLIKLSLTANIITDKGIEIISKNQAIQELYLRQNQLTDSCAAPLASMKSLERVDLSVNRITDIGLKILNESNIREVDLDGSWNKDGIKKLTSERFQLRDRSQPAFPTSAFEVSKKPERKEEVEKEEVEVPSKRPKAFHERLKV